MKSCIVYIIGAFVSVLTVVVFAQDKASQDTTPVTPPTVTADYPHDRAGVLIRNSDWIPIPSEAPAKSHIKHGLAPALTYGIAPAQVVSDYDGLHARVQIEPGRPIICLYHVMFPPGNPALVILHPKKTYRQLDGGKLRLRGKVAEAEKNDLIPINVSQPENGVWLIQPQQDLAPGEYALMLGTQNLSIFPFTVAAASPTSPTPEKH
jgi:hypothetical protein